jgi:hypothetical protein
MAHRRHIRGASIRAQARAVDALQRTVALLRTEPRTVFELMALLNCSKPMVCERLRLVDLTERAMGRAGLIVSAKRRPGRPGIAPTSYHLAPGGE